MSYFYQYHTDPPKYIVEECQGVRYHLLGRAYGQHWSVDRDEFNPNDPLANSIEQMVYLGNLPFMTERGTFIINGAERIIVSQLHRSPGVFFDEVSHPNGTKLYSARIIPLRGSWVEFTTDINDLMIVYIDRRKKFLVTTLLRAVGFATDRDILDIELTQVPTAHAGSEIIGSRVVDDIIDKETGEVILDRYQEITEEKLKRLQELKVRSIDLVKSDKILGQEIITKTLIKDGTRSQEEALETIYQHLRSGEADLKPPPADRTAVLQSNGMTPAVGGTG